MGQRLLPIDVQAAPQRRHADRRVHVIRRGDIHRLQVLLLLQQFAVIPINPRLRTFLAKLARALLRSTSHAATTCTAGMAGDRWSRRSTPSPKPQRWHD